MKQFIKTSACALALALTLSACGGAASSTAASTATSGAADASSAATITANHDYSEYLEDSGFYAGIKAADLVTLCDYNAIEIPAEDSEASDEEVQSAIDDLLLNYQTTEQDKESAVADGDSVNIDYVGSVDGEEFSGGNTQGTGTDIVVGTTTYIDDFIDQIKGHKPGETFDVNVTFPDEYSTNPDLEGKDAVFVTTVNYITKTVTPEFNDEFVKNNLEESYGYKSAEEAKQSIKDELIFSKQINYVWTDLMGDCTIKEIPQNLIDAQLDDALASFETQASYYGTTADVLAQYSGYESLEAYKEAIKPSMEQTVKQYLISQAIAEKEGLEVTDEAASDYLGNVDIAAIKEYYGAGYVNRQVLMEVVTKHIIEK